MDKKNTAIAVLAIILSIIAIIGIGIGVGPLKPSHVGDTDETADTIVIKHYHNTTTTINVTVIVDGGNWSTNSTHEENTSYSAGGFNDKELR